MHASKQTAFTLIELSIVLVIIGLIVGGVLVGKDLIKAAEIRAQISQLERYQTAVNTFRLKYHYLPGDIPASEVAALGFTATPTRDGVTGNGDGNGFLQSVDSGDNNSYGGDQCHENLYFWEDLSANSRLIEGNFSSALNAGFNIAAGSADNYFPKGKIGNSHVITYSLYESAPSTPINNYTALSRGANFFGLVGIDSTVNHGWPRGTPPLAVIDANNIDRKIDDGYPETGIVRAFAVNAGNIAAGPPEFSWYSNAAASSSTTCFNTSTTAGVYSTDSNGGNGLNCRLSIEMK